MSVMRISPKAQSVSDNHHNKNLGLATVPLCLLLLPVFPGEVPRTKSAQLLVNKLPEITNGPAIVVGDLNAGELGPQASASTDGDCYGLLVTAVRA